MRVSVLNFRSDILLRSAALSLIAGLGAGCSSDFSRFAPTSSDYTGSINQQQIINKSAPIVRQPFPEQTRIAAAPTYNEPSLEEPIYTGSVQSDGTIRPMVSATKSAVRRTVLAPVAGAGAAVAAGASTLKEKVTAPISAARRAVTQPSLADVPETAALEPVAAVKKKAKALVEPVDRTVTGAVETAKPMLAPVRRQPMPEVSPVEVAKSSTKNGVKTVSSREPAQEGWSAIGGTSITVHEGETVYNLAKRFGVPANAILEANNIPNASGLKSGQRVIIPTYIYSSTAKVSAPDANADVALAKSSRGTVTDVPVEKVPLPRKVPAHDDVAVLPSVPQVPQVREKQSSEATTQTAISKVDQPGFKVIAKKSASTTVSKSSGGVYSVASGDSLYTIAKKNGTTVDALKAANGLVDGKLKIGQSLKIPSAGATVAAVKAPAQAGVDPIVTGSSNTSLKKPAIVKAQPMASKAVAVVPKTETSAAVAEAEKDTAAAPGSTGISKLRWPVRGRTLTGYGQADAGKLNDGVDISVPNGTPVKAAENGVVIYAGTGLKDFGNTVLVKHDNGLVTVYGHNGNILVKRGQTIKRGQEIAKSGMSGNTKVPKLHFEVRKNSTPVNPASFLE